jgi:hypothetical protein
LRHDYDSRNAAGGFHVTDNLESVASEFGDGAMISDDELSALALAADPDTVVADDAVNLWELAGHEGGLLPDWYMPALSSGSRVHPRWRRRVAMVIICAFLVVDAYGLCSTYGYLVVA